MENTLALAFLSAILSLGIAAQWIAWRIKLPSILLLLGIGFVLGVVCGDNPQLPGTNITDEIIPHHLLFPVVSICVAIIMFEGGLTLQLRELEDSGQIVLRIVSIGVLVSWVLATLACILLIGMHPRVAALTGAILVVTGPTVIGPLLRHVRPSRRVSSILKWEGIVIDPIGAILAVLTYEALIHQGSAAAVFGELVKIIVIGLSLGIATAAIMIWLLRRYLIPDFLHNPAFLAAAIGTFTLSNLLAEEAGLVTATIFGIALANQKQVPVRHVVEFKENLRVLLISTLFIMLSARITSAQIEALPWGRTALFAGILILAVRPLSVLASTLGQKIGAPEKAMLAGMAPRGIVAAAVASIFAAGLADKGVPGPAEQFAPAIFAVIVATVCVYGLLGVPLARLLGISSGGDRGVLIVGAQPLCREIGLVLKSEDIDVLMADTNRANATAARMAGLRSFYGNVLSDDVEEAVDLGGIGRVFAMTPNDEVNSLISVQLKEHFGSAMMYQPSMPDAGKSAERTVSRDLKARVLFRDGITLRDLQRRHDAGATIKKTPLTESFGMEQFRARYGGDALPLFLITPTGRLRVFTADDDVTPQPGDKLIAMISEPVGGAKAA
ncbi:MAG: sodium:proton antiporter [Planctomycetales bacterium]|nr:sodium:proton antiporter [Planctomycetales bacterium]